MTSIKQVISDVIVMSKWLSFRFPDCTSWGPVCAQVKQGMWKWTLPCHQWHSWCGKFVSLVGMPDWHFAQLSRRSRYPSTWIQPIFEQIIIHEVWIYRGETHVLGNQFTLSLVVHVYILIQQRENLVDIYKCK